MYIILCLILIHVSYPNQKDSVEVNLIFRPLDSKLRVFEMELFKKIISFYNLKNEQKLKLVTHKEPDFNRIRPLMLSDKFKNKHVSSISSFTISNIPNFDYSSAYLPVRNAFISLNDYNYKNDKIRCGYNNNPYTVNVINSLDEKNQFEFIPYSSSNDLYVELKKGNIECYFFDSYVTFFNQEIKVIKYTSEETSYLGIIFKKNSELKKMLNPTIKYFVTSTLYYSMLRKYLGRDISTYVEKMLKRSN